MLRYSIAILLMLTACSPQDADVGPSGSATSSALSIEGEYIVTAVDQADPVIGIEGSEPTVTIAESRIHFQSQCIFADWQYQLTDDAITTGPPHDGEPVEMCARSRAPGETAIVEAFSAAESVRRVRSGLYFDGGGRSVQLRRTVSAEDLASRVVDLSGEWRVTALDGEALPFPLELEADFEQLWWEPGCALQYRDYTIRGSNFDTEPADLSGSMVCDIGYPEQLTEVWQAMDAAEMIAAMPDGGIEISGGGRSVLLVAR